MKAQRRLTSIAIAAFLLLGIWLTPGANAAAQPAWKLVLNPMPANFAPGSSPEYLLAAANVGAKATTGEPVSLKLSLQGGLSATSAEANNRTPGTKAPICTVEKDEPSSVTCTTTEVVNPGRLVLVRVAVKVTATEGTLEAIGSIEGGGGAPQEVSATAPVSSSPVPFDFLPGFSLPASTEEGFAAAGAGTHPYQLTASLNFPTERLGKELTGAGHPRDIVVDLPRGLLGNPAAVPKLCTEAQLTSQDSPGCPEASQVGVINLTTTLVGVGTIGVENNNLYAMVPPPGVPAELGFDLLRVGVFGHLSFGIRSDGDYGIYSYSNDTIALGSNPAFNVQAQIWGDPSGKEHDLIRGDCEKDSERINPKTSEPEPCSLPPKETAFLTMPGDCPGTPPLFKAFADSWEEPSPPFKEREASYEGADLGGTPAPIDTCGALKFEPDINAKLTTNLTDSPSGLDFDVHQPQDTKLKSLAMASMKDITIEFPAGLAVNPAQASGLGACSEGQIGFAPKEGEIHFSKTPQSCPEAAKIGTVEATSPLLVRRSEDPKREYEVEVDPETGEPFLEPLHGSIYLAQPFANPFGSLAAVYLAIEDPKTGTIAKVAGEARLDPVSGRISARFEENPELPIEDIKTHLFGGPRGSFITPPTCGTYDTATDITPWSAPEGKDTFPADSFGVSIAPSGGPCPASEAQMPHHPSLSAGAVSPQAGKYSPFTFKLSRADGSQRLAKIDATLPSGLSARLAGVARCSEAQIAKARSREVPQRGALEQADPSCPAASQIGTLNVGVGAGPAPYYAQGRAYMAGPYKGAPLSFVFIVPAVAGPFDLGTVLSRTAVYLDPTTAQGRVVSDPLPTILDGVPTDLRSVSVHISRPGFILNPTSCDEKSFGGSVVSVLGAIAPLAERFQVGGCKALPFKPKVSARLFGPIHRGGHPRARGVLTTKPGEANLARLSFTLPRSEFIDQSHFRTICTRVQFAANQCPAGSVYAQVRAFTPLLDYPLEGPVYLRSSSHELPDLVAALRGPPEQPLAIDVVGRVDSVNGGLRVRVESVPDAPVSKLVITAQGGKKGLFQNSTNICKGTHRVTLKLIGQNAKRRDLAPELKAQCNGKARKAPR
jgi:hypothetical protein